MVQWDVTTNLEMPREDFAMYTKCHESPLLSERYTLCGAKAGIDAKPITIQVDPWSGRPDSLLRFTVVPKKEMKDKKDKVMIFEAKKNHGLLLLFVFLLKVLLCSLLFT